jgi:hypothetical protein
MPHQLAPEKGEREDRVLQDHHPTDRAVVCIDRGAIVVNVVVGATVVSATNPIEAGVEQMALKSESWISIEGT